MQIKKFATVLVLLLHHYLITRKSISVDRNAHIRDGKRGGVVLQAVCVSRVRCKPCPEAELDVGSVWWSHAAACPQGWWWWLRCA